MTPLAPYPVGSLSVNSGDGGGYGGGYYGTYGWRSDPYKLRRDALVRALQGSPTPMMPSMPTASVPQGNL